MRGIGDHEVLSVLLLLGPAAVAGYVLRATSRDSWPRGWRWQCRIGRHKPQGRYPKDHHCVHCGHYVDRSEARGPSDADPPDARGGELRDEESALFR